MNDSEIIALYHKRDESAITCTDEKYGKYLGTIAYNILYDTFESDDTPSDPLGKEIQEWMNKENINTVPWVFSVFPSQNFKTDFGAALLQYAQGTKSWSDVVSTFVNRWEEEAT